MTPSRSEIAMRERIEELEELVRQLKEQLVPPLTFPLQFKLTSSETNLLAFLYARAPHVIPRERINAALWLDDGVAPYVKIIDVLVCKLRKKLAPFGVDVETSWGVGYRLSASARDRLEQLMNAESAERSA